MHARECVECEQNVMTEAVWPQKRKSLFILFFSCEACGTENGMAACPSQQQTTTTNNQQVLIYVIFAICICCCVAPCSSVRAVIVAAATCVFAVRAQFTFDKKIR